MVAGMAVEHIFLFKKKVEIAPPGANPEQEFPGGAIIESCL